MAQAMEEGERKKRKITIEDEEQDEDVKMEKFFAIIRRAKDIRDLLLESEETIQQRKAASERENIRRWQPPISAAQDPEESQERRKIAMIGVNQQDACAWVKRSEEQDDDKAGDDEDEDDDEEEEEDKNHRQGRRLALDVAVEVVRQLLKCPSSHEAPEEVDISEAADQKRTGKLPTAAGQIYNFAQYFLYSKVAMAAWLSDCNYFCSLY